MLRSRRCKPPGFTATCSPLTGERSAGVRKLFRLIQLEQVAERIVQEGLVPGTGDERDPVHLDALPLQIGDGGIDVVYSDREVVRTSGWVSDSIRCTCWPPASSQYPRPRSGRGSCVMPSTSR